MASKKLTCAVAMGTYNGEKYIIEQLKSIENQTVLPDEIVIFDDCSTDNTVQVIAEFAKTSKLKINLNRNQTNLGCRRNYENIYASCHADIVFSCDQDDVWLSNKVETFLKEFEKDDQLVYAFSDAYVTDENLQITRDGEWSQDWTQYNRQSFFDYVQTRNFPLGFQVAVRKTLIDQILPLLSDPDGWVAQCAAVFGNVKAIPEKLVYYRRHANATSQAHRQTKAGYGTYIKKIFTTKYQRHFLYPTAELETYSRILEYAKKTQGIDASELENHIRFLSALDRIEKKSCITRLKTVKQLKKQGLYSQYRGNANRYKVDCLYLFVNSFKPKSKR